MNDWIEWKGGGCPVERGTLVDVKYRDTRHETYGIPALEHGIEQGRCAVDWSHKGFSSDIIAYRLHKPEAAEAPDLVNSPPHYKQGDIECIDAIKAALTEEEFRGYCKGNAIKYSWRERHKGGDESLKKAIWYLDRLTK